MLSFASFANEYIHVKIYIYKTLYFFISMANLLSLSEEFPHLSNRLGYSYFSFGGKSDKDGIWDSGSSWWQMIRITWEALLQSIYTRETNTQ